MVSLKEKEHFLEEENRAIINDILRCLQGAGETGRKRIALMVQEVRDDGKPNPR